ncbi:MAG TPA: CPBP family intramembrane glutamic endopeptidase [Acidimicrobiia bacterium]|nr:CPBP family intramembrane glutamic endopeptidase [Acidimicrobiia bacterium]
MWFAFTVGALLLLFIDNLTLWALVVAASALLLSLVPRFVPSVTRKVDGRDLVAVAVIYLGVVAAFRLAFTVFTTDNVLGLFLAFAFGLVLGVVGPIVYQVWIRSSDLRSLGFGLHQLPQTLAIGVGLGAIQFGITFWGYRLPAPVDWVPLLAMSLVVGLFEAVFFRGFIQNRLEASFGLRPAIAIAASLYSLYHVGYGMGIEEMWFLFGLGVVYAIAFRLTRNNLVLWPILTPMGAFFNNLESGDIDLPWASILGFADVAGIMAGAVWLAHRHIRKRAAGSAESKKPPRVPSRHPRTIPRPVTNDH